MKKILLSLFVFTIFLRLASAQDAEVLSITAPNNTTSCALTATELVKVSVKNNGAAEITNVPISYKINAGTNVVESVPTIAAGATVEYIFTQTADLSSPESYTIVATISLPGDINTANDSKTVTVTNIDGLISIDFKTDIYASESSWKVLDRDGVVVASGSGYANQTEHHFDVCVFSNGCYTFKFLDSYGDGMGGNGTSTAGYLTVKYNNVVIGGFPNTNANFGSVYNIFSIGTGCTEIDLALSKIKIPFFALPELLSIPGEITNVGEVPITSFDVTYNVDGGTESAVYSVTGLNVAVGEAYQFIHNVQNDFATEGSYTINMSVSNVNGGGEVNLDNNTLSKNITISNTQLQRNVILENFTTGQCPNCPPIHVLLENYTSTQPNAILIAQHAGYGTDLMTIPENTELLALYNKGGSTYAPALAIDRFFYQDGLVATPDPGPVFWPGENTTATITRINERLAVPAGVSVNIEGTYDLEKHLTITVSGELVTNLSSYNDLRLVVYVKEDGLVYNQAGGSATYIHNNVMRDAISATWGDAGVITTNTTGTTFTKTYTYTLAPTWNMENLQVVAFVANYDASVNNREILNAESKEITQLLLSGVDEVNNQISIYPNPISDKMKIQNAENSNIEIYDILGKLVYTQNKLSSNEVIDLSDLQVGTYTVKCINETKVITKKIVISR